MSTIPGTELGEAVFSLSGEHRYRLTRENLAPPPAHLAARKRVCLGQNHDGTQKHPLYLAKNQPLETRP